MSTCIFQVISCQSLALAGLIVASIVGDLHGQEDFKRSGRFGLKPGEIITRPDKSQRWQDDLKVGAVAPEFTLPMLKLDNGNPITQSLGAAQASEVSLKELRKQKPVVLVFGSITCPPFRNQLDGIDEVYDDFSDKANFLFIYVREAHPDSVLSIRDSEGIESLQKIPQAADAIERTQAAAYCQKSLDLKLPIAVDTVHNDVGQAYAGWPNRMVVVDTSGEIIYAGEPSPGGTDAKRLRDWLTANIGEGN